MKYSDLVAQFSLAQRIRLFGSYFSKKDRGRVTFDLWPMQQTKLNIIDADRKKGIWQHFGPKARQNGESEMAGEQACDSAYCYSRFETVVISKKSDDAEYFLAHRILAKLLHRQEQIPKICAQLGIPVFDFPKLTWPTEMKESVSKIVLDNGSTFRALSATNTSGAGMTADAVILDEAGGFDEVGDLDILLGNIEPIIENSVAAGIGWMLVIGTSEPGSAYNDIISQLWKSPEKYPTRRMIFLPWQCKPSRTEEWYNQQMEKDPIMTRLQYPATLDDFFTVKSGLIYPQFDEDKHVIDFEPQSTDRLYILFDQGFKHGSSILFMYYDKNRRIVKIRTEMTYVMTDASVIAVELKRALKKLSHKPTKLIADTSIFKETGVVSIAKVFYKQGIRWQPAFKSDEQGGISIISGLLQRNRIVIHPECSDLIREFQIWKWAKNGKKPEDCNNDGLDAFRYGISEVFGQGGAGSERYEPKDPYRHIGLLPGFNIHPSSGPEIKDNREDWEKGLDF